MSEMDANERMQRELEIMQQYRVYYEARNPLPAREVYAADNRLIYVALTALVIASVIVSAYHTIPIFVGEELTIITFIVGLAVFTMVELGIVSLTYINIKKAYELNANKHADVLKWLRAGLGLVFIVGIGANVYSTTRDAGFTAPVIDLAIRIIVGLSAPVTAFVCGEVLAMTGVDGQAKQRELDTAYTVKLVEYQEEFLKAWDARKSKWVGTVRVSNEPQHSIPSVSNGIPLENRVLPSASTIGHKKAPDAAERVRKYYSENPEALELSPLEVSQLLGVGKSTVYNIRNEMKKGDSQ